MHLKRHGYIDITDIPFNVIYMYRCICRPINSNLSFSQLNAIFKYPVYSTVCRGNLVLRHCCPCFPPESEGIAC